VKKKKKPPAIPERIEKRFKKIEARIEEIAVEVGKNKESFLEGLARVIHGPSQPPPPLLVKKPHDGDDRTGDD
jgi:hypothetical protein